MINVIRQRVYLKYQKVKTYLQTDQKTNTRFITNMSLVTQADFT